MDNTPVMEDAQMRHAFKMAPVTGQTPPRDLALLHVQHGNGMTATEVAQLEVAELLDERDEFKRQSGVRPLQRADQGLEYRRLAHPVMR